MNTESENTAMAMMLEKERELRKALLILENVINNIDDDIQSNMKAQNKYNSIRRRINHYKKYRKGRLYI